MHWTLHCIPVGGGLIDARRSFHALSSVAGSPFTKFMSHSVLMKRQSGGSTNAGKGGLTLEGPKTQHRHNVVACSRTRKKCSSARVSLSNNFMKTRIISHSTTRVPYFVAGSLFTKSTKPVGIYEAILSGGAHVWFVMEC